MSKREAIEALRLKLVDKFHERIFNPEDPYTYEKFRDFSHARALSAATLILPEDHKIKVDVITNIETTSGVPKTSRQRESQGLAVEMLHSMPKPRFFN